MRHEVEPVYQLGDETLRILTRNNQLERVDLEIPRKLLEIPLDSGKKVVLTPKTSRVEIIGRTEDALRVMGAAGKNCYSFDGPVEIFSRLGEDEASNFLGGAIIPSGHYSVLEHGYLNVAVEGISRACSHQLVRHRLFSYSQESQRYVNPFKQEVEVVSLGFIIPPVVRYQEELLVDYFAGVRGSVENYIKALSRGVKEEDARMLLPNAMETKLVISGNLRTFFEMFTKRLCGLAQWEIDIMATQMAELASEKVPVLFDQAGPNCVIYDRCPEGRRSCGINPGPISEIKGQEHYPHDILTLGEK